ncbi:MAG TPA: cupin domain-containing protein, partial [Chloroflexota bacterium]
TERQYRDDSSEGGVGRPAPKIKLQTKSWQAVSLPENVHLEGTSSYIPLTRNKAVQTVMNVYSPGNRDELHCHPGSEHIFMVWQGQATIRGINEGEEIVLNPGELVHIKAGHYYQLCNDTDDILVLYQVATIPAKRSPMGRRSFRRAGDVSADDLNDRGVTTK